MKFFLKFANGLEVGRDCIQGYSGRGKVKSLRVWRENDVAEIGESKRKGEVGRGGGGG